MAMWNIKRTVAEPIDEKQLAVPVQVAVPVPDIAQSRDRDAIQRNLNLKVSIHRALLDKINLSALEQLSREQIQAEVGELVAEILEEQHVPLSAKERKNLVTEVLDELLGLGPLEPLLKDESITDILVNGHNLVFVERLGLLEKVGTCFQDEKHLLRIIQKIVSAVGRRIDESSPFVDARLADGSRVNAIIAPLAIDGSLLSIRKFAKKRISIERMVELGSLPAAMAEVLKAIVRSRRNILISGGTGAGKNNPAQRTFVVH